MTNTGHVLLLTNAVSCLLSKGKKLCVTRLPFGGVLHTLSMALMHLLIAVVLGPLLLLTVIPLVFMGFVALNYNLAWATIISRAVLGVPEGIVEVSFPLCSVPVSFPRQ